MSPTFLYRCAWSTIYSGASEAEYIKYHDEEWGVPCVSDERLMEYIVLDGAQCGLSWSTILAKRTAYTEAYKQWNISEMAKMVRTWHVGSIQPPELCPAGSATPSVTCMPCSHACTMCATDAAPFTASGLHEAASTDSYNRMHLLVLVQDDADVARLLQPDSGIVKHRGKIESAINNARIVLDLQKEHGSLARYLWYLMPNQRPIVNQFQCVTALRRFQHACGYRSHPKPEVPRSPHAHVHVQILRQRRMPTPQYSGSNMQDNARASCVY
jgi:3-methyladenine DNA glycosylase Tag